MLFLRRSCNCCTQTSCTLSLPSSPPITTPHSSISTQAPSSSAYLVTRRKRPKSCCHLWSKHSSTVIHKECTFLCLPITRLQLICTQIWASNSTNRKWVKSLEKVTSSCVSLSHWRVLSQPPYPPPLPTPSRRETRHVKRRHAKKFIISCILFPLIYFEIAS